MGWFSKEDPRVDLVLTKQNFILKNQLYIIELLKKLIKGEERMSAELDALVAQVTENTSVEQSAVTLIQGLADQIAAAVANNDGPALAALSTQLKGSSDALAAAITANTPPVPPT